MKRTQLFALCGALATVIALLAGCSSNDDLNGDIDTSKLPPPLPNGPTASGAANAGGAPVATPAASNTAAKPNQ